jgi:hypothetical protein
MHDNDPDSSDIEVPQASLQNWPAVQAPKEFASQGKVFKTLAVARRGNVVVLVFQDGGKIFEVDAAPQNNSRGEQCWQPKSAAAPREVKVSSAKQLEGGRMKPGAATEGLWDESRRRAKQQNPTVERQSVLI